MKIPQGNTKDDIAARKKIITDFYHKWKDENPDKKVYNCDLDSYIHIRSISIGETAAKASRTYQSTLAVLQLEIVLQTAKLIRRSNIKTGNSNQSKFTKMLIMQTVLVGIGSVKLVVGVKIRGGENVQYSITQVDIKKAP